MPQAARKLDQRGYNSEATRKKKEDAGRAGKGPSAVARKRRSLRDPKLQDRIEAVVAAALAAENVKVIPGNTDVVRHIRGRLMVNNRVRGSRVG